jgi:hypothetical protein
VVADEQLTNNPDMTHNTLPQYISTIINNDACDIRDELIIKPFP